MTPRQIRAARHVIVFSVVAVVLVIGVPGLCFKVWRERR